MAKVTVSMASYNHEKFVGPAIESVLSQTGCDFEYVIVDDGSTDQTVREILKFKDPRIRFIPLEHNRGACVALRKAIEEGTGDYIAILNSDDVFLPGKLEKQVTFLNEHPHIAAVFAYPLLVDEKGHPVGKKSFCGDSFKQPNRSRHEWLNFFFYNYNALCHPTVMIRRSCYDELGYYDPRFSKLPDFDFWIRLLLKHEIHILPEELIQFRILSNAGNASAPTLEAKYRNQWEHSHILKHYLTIPSIEEYLTIFPEEAPHVRKKNSEFVPFYFANLALRAKVHTDGIYRLFGLDTLFSLLENSELREKLASDLNFSYSDFIKISPPIFQFNPRTLKGILKKCSSPSWVFWKLKQIFTNY
jgi:glycosyltransferase involved in cell wall biosynthesis